MSRREKVRVSTATPLPVTLESLAQHHHERGRPYTALLLREAARQVERLTTVDVERAGRIAELEAELAQARVQISALQDELSDARASLAWADRFDV